MASFTTNAGSLGLQNGTVVYASDTIKARLVLSSITPAKTDTSMTGYTAATGSTDQTLANKTLATDAGNNRTVYDNTVDPVWAAVAAGPEIGYIVVYKFVTNDAGSTPLFIEEITPRTPNGSDLTWPINAAGIAYTQQ